MQAEFLSYLSERSAGLGEPDIAAADCVLDTPQRARVRTTGGREYLNFCSDNYLGLTEHPVVVSAARSALDRWGFGIAATQETGASRPVHRQLEERLAHFLGTEEVLLYPSSLDAAACLAETILTPDNVVLADEGNQPNSVGLSQCGASRCLPYRHRDLDHLETRLRETATKRFRFIVTDGVFAADGAIADLRAIATLAARYGAQLMINDAHGAGILGTNGRGTHDYWDVLDQVDIVGGSLATALGGVNGAYLGCRGELATALRQTSRHYRSTPVLAPSLAAGVLAGLDLINCAGGFRERLLINTRYLRQELVRAGLPLKASEHPIVCVMPGDAALTARMVHQLHAEGILVSAHRPPAVPAGQACIRLQVSAAHSEESLAFGARMLARIREDCTAPSHA